MTVYRCRHCDTVYNLYTGTIFQQRHLTPRQVVLLLRGFRMGKKGKPHRDPLDPPRRRANKRRGKGTYVNDRPSIVGSVGRESGQVCLRVYHDTTAETLLAHVHRFTQAGSHLYTDEERGYNHVIRDHSTVCHNDHEWTRDDDGDGVREVHVNTAEGMWTDVRNFLRPFKGVHKKYLSGYGAMCEFKHTLIPTLGDESYVGS